jgi:diguanylate cyclase (GGDEF)-like protein
MHMATTGVDPVPTYLIHPNGLLAIDTALQMAQAGYPVTILASLTALAEVHASAVPAILVIDLGKQMMSAEMTLQLQQLRQQADFSLLCISSRGNFESRLRAVKAGAEKYFTRPLDMIAFSEDIEALLHRRQAPQYRLLLVSDDDATAHTLQQPGIELVVLRKPAELFNMLADCHAEMIVIDLTQAQLDGIDIVKLIRQDPLYLDIPIVCLGRSDAGNDVISHVISQDTTAIEALAAGADDYLDTSSGATRISTTLISRAERYRALRGLIMRDSLTGLYNHAAIKEYLGREMALIERHKAPLSMAMIDLDFFKKVNDTYGHPVGDQVIRGLARLLQQRLRRGDIIGRYGGEEFVVLMPATTIEAAVAVLTGIGEVFATMLHYADSVAFASTFSAGVAEARGHTSAEAMLESADTALYEAKRAGRNCVVAAAPE